MSYNDKSPYNKEVEQLNQYLNNFYQWFFNNRGGAVLVVAVVLILLWLSFGFYVIQPGEEGVVRTFGRFSSIAGPGLNYHIPWPVQAVETVDVQRVRRAEIGFRTTGPDLKQEILQEALMLTADENIVQVEVLVQYRIADSRDFVFNVVAPEEVLRTSTEVALRSTVGQMGIDAVITEERALVQNETRAFLTRLLDDYQAGILVTDVRLQVADPPEEVRDAFQEVVRALADRERLINEAQAYQNDIVPRARGDRQRLIEEASAFKEQEVLRATGDAQRFLSVLGAYREAPEVTRERLHIEALEGILDNVGLIMLDEGAIGNQVLPFLPLTEPNGNGEQPQPDASPPRFESPPPTENNAPAEGGNE